MNDVQAFLALTSLREIGLSNCRFFVPTSSCDGITFPHFECSSVVTVKLAGAQVILNENTVLREPELLPFVVGFTMLQELDLSAPLRSGLGSSTSSIPFIIDDKCITNFFGTFQNRLR